MKHKIPLIGIEKQNLKKFLYQCGIENAEINMRTAQIWSWIYARGIREFQNMTNLSQTLRNTLEDHFSTQLPEIIEEHISKDGTHKWLLRLSPDQYGKQHDIETVYIPEEERGTLCLSTQVGCTLNCRFCHTGTQKLTRNLSDQEIVAQIMLARDKLNDLPTSKHNIKRKITNIVFMGMGEPLYNLDNLVKACHTITDGTGIALSKRRVTISTSGIVPNIQICGEKTGVMLAVSLHATRNEIRNEIVPINRKYPIEMLLEECRKWPGLSNAKRITFEYVMLKNINDHKTHAYELLKLLQGIPAKINLIPFNSWPGTDYQCSDWHHIEEFAEIINRGGYASPIRMPRGHDIMAACGQLKSTSLPATQAQRKKKETGHAYG